MKREGRRSRGGGRSQLVHSGNGAEVWPSFCSDVEQALVSPDPTAKPLIVHNYFAEPDDMRLQVDGARIAMEIVATEPFASCVGTPFMAPASNSDEDITAHTRAHGQTAYHPVGTCKMGVDEVAVVDPELRVRGVE